MTFNKDISTGNIITWIVGIVGLAGTIFLAGQQFGAVKSDIATNKSKIDQLIDLSTKQIAITEEQIALVRNNQQDLTVLAQTIATDEKLAKEYAEIKKISDGIYN